MSFHAALADDSMLLCLYDNGFKHWKQKYNFMVQLKKIKNTLNRGYGPNTRLFSLKLLSLAALLWVLLSPFPATLLDAGMTGRCGILQVLPGGAVPRRDVFTLKMLLIDPSAASWESMEKSCVDTEKSAV